MILTFDIEVYPNYFLAHFDCIITGASFEFRMYNDVKDHDVGDLRNLLENNLIITFNGMTYDMPMTCLYMAGATNYELKRANDNIIGNRLKYWEVERFYGIKVPPYDHIDLIEVAFGTASLKIYGARLGTKLLQELPIHFNNFIMPWQREIIDLYCGNDNIVTRELYEELIEQIDLRIAMSKEYGIDLRSKSDAQIAEHVIKSEYKRATGKTLKKPKAKKSYKYNPPTFVGFQGEQLKALYETCRTVDFNISAKGAVLLPKELNKQIEIAGKKYKMGIGGLHSVDKGGSYYSEDGYQLIDIDAASFYPYIILNGGFEPIHIGELFTIIYRSIVERRIAAKRKMKEIIKLIDETTDPERLKVLKAELKTQNTIQGSLKIVINGLFGKFGSRYSVVYSPDLMFHTTVTGQLCLFMLIEQFEVAGIEVVSANTDGILVRCHDDMREHLDALVKWWEDATAFEMEYTFYKSFHQRDVNSYLAITPDGGAKRKGIFKKPNISKNPAHQIIYDAVNAYIADGTRPFDTIFKCGDISKFLEVRKVAGGAIKDDMALGSAIRWYISDDTDTAINYAKTGNQVAGSECGMPMMNLPDDGYMPPDLNMGWYIDRAEAILDVIGIDDFKGKVKKKGRKDIIEPGYVRGADPHTWVALQAETILI